MRKLIALTVFLVVVLSATTASAAYTPKSWSKTFTVTGRNAAGASLFNQVASVAWRRDANGKLYYVSRSCDGQRVGLGRIGLLGLTWHYTGIVYNSAGSQGGTTLTSKYHTKYWFGGDLLWGVVSINDIVLMRSTLMAEAVYDNSGEANSGSAVSTDYLAAWYSVASELRNYFACYRPVRVTVD